MQSRTIQTETQATRTVTRTQAEQAFGVRLVANVVRTGSLVYGGYSPFHLTLTHTEQDTIRVDCARFGGNPHNGGGVFR
jgi:hypothetical protein